MGKNKVVYFYYRDTEMSIDIITMFSESRARYLFNRGPRILVATASLITWKGSSTCFLERSATGSASPG